MTTVNHHDPSNGYDVSKGHDATNGQDATNGHVACNGHEATEGHDPSVGYRPHWSDTTEYIEDITYRIWEQGDLEYIADTYSADCPVYTLAGSCTGYEVVIKNTRDMLVQFPDRTLFPAAILWNGSNTTGYHSSHLISTAMTYHHTQGAESEFSAETHGKKARIWVVAHCEIKNGVIVEEFLVRDNQRLYSQLGVSGDSVARMWAKRWLAERKDPAKSSSSHLSWLSAEFKRVQQHWKPDQGIKINLENIAPSERELNEYLGVRIAGLYGKVWGPQGLGSREQFEKQVKQLYHPHARYESPQTRDTGLTGWEEIFNLYDTFSLGNEQGSQLAVSLDWIIVNPEHETRRIPSNGGKTNAWRYPTAGDKEFKQELESKFSNSDQVSLHYTLAIRWTLVGYKTQSGVQAPVVLLAESHLQCAGFRVIRDITVYDNVAVNAQIYAAVGVNNED